MPEVTVTEAELQKQRIDALEKRINDLEKALMKAILHLTLHEHLPDGRPAASLRDILQ